jgi:hypothetical protein
VHQNRVVTTARGSEVVSDPTNALAVEAAARRSAGDPGPVHLAACCRVVRAQAFDGPGLSAHFRLFALVSTGRDTGSGRTEAAMLVEHLGYWHDALVRLRVREAVTLSGTPFAGGVLAERLTDEVLPTLAARGAAVRLDGERTHGAGYYDGGVALSIDADGPEGQLGDGGATTWTAQLLGNRKERCLASCISTERLAARVAAS